MRDKELLALEQDLFASKSDTSKAIISHKKLQLYILENDYSTEALDASKRVDSKLLPDSLKAYYFWNSAILAFIHKETRLSVHQLENYKKISGDSSFNVVLLETIARADYDTAQVTAITKKYKDSLGCLQCLNEVSSYSRKNKNAYVIMSAIVPGSGTIANGNPGKGMASLVINSASVYALYYMINNGLYINAIAWGSSWGLKFYTGNLRLTAREFDKKEARKKNKLATNCELVLNDLIKKYPIEYKK